MLTEAGKKLFENNPLTTVCSLVCDHEKQCEGHCVLGKKGAPVHFSTVENYISTTYANKMTKGPHPSNGIKAAIIGSGPAGITIAIILARYGYDVTIFEGKDKIGGVLRYGIPEFRLPKSVLDDIKYRHLDLKGIKFRPNTHIGGAIGIDDLFRDGYKAIFVGTGVWKPNALHIKGETLGTYTLASTISTTRTAISWETELSSSAPATRPWMWPEPPSAKAPGISPAFPSPKNRRPATTSSATPAWKAWYSSTTKRLWRSRMKA